MEWRDLLPKHGFASARAARFCALVQGALFPLPNVQKQFFENESDTVPLYWTQTRTSCFKGIRTQFHMCIKHLIIKHPGVMWVDLGGESLLRSAVLRHRVGRYHVSG